MARRVPGSDGLKARIQRMVAGKVAEAIGEQSEARQRLLELGIVDEAWLADPSSDPTRPLDRLKELRQEVADEPSILARLGVEPIAMLGAQSAMAGEAPGDPAAELTVVFTDLEGFTSFTEERGDAVAGRLLRSHYSVVDEIVEGRGGSVVKRLGDGHMASFTTPRAAVLASLELVRASPDEMRLRAGGHLGGVVRLGGDLVGHTVNLAARVAASASGGHLRVTTAVSDTAGPVPGAAYGPPETVRLKGIDEPVRVREVTSDAA
ncbi:MAG: adenylate/guanylate cyclase domain-containing protein [Acidimicrobiia bacterium]|nr:adenylate/guanylate cyclase domain-containing protein [Acidimicrobiia bacterium]